MIIELLGIIGGGALLLHMMREKPAQTPESDTETATEPQESTTEPTEPTPHPDTESVAAEVTAALEQQQQQQRRKAFIYNRMQGDLKRVFKIQNELEKVERLLTTVESYAYFLSNGQLEKPMTLNVGTFGGENAELTIDLINDENSRNMIHDTLIKRRETLRSSLLDEMTRISSYAVTETVTKTTDFENLKNVVTEVLKRGGAA